MTSYSFPSSMSLLQPCSDSVQNWSPLQAHLTPHLCVLSHSLELCHPGRNQQAALTQAGAQ